MDWQTALIAEVVGCFAAYVLVGCIVGLIWRRLDRERVTLTQAHQA